MDSDSVITFLFIFAFFVLPSILKQIKARKKKAPQPRKVNKNKKIFSIFVEEDYRIRDYIMKFYPRGTVASVIIERLNTSSIKIKIRTSRPGIVIGRRGQEIERLREEISNFTNKEIYIDVEEISQPALEAQLVADNIAFQLEKRVSHRRAMKRAIQMVRLGGAEGVKIRCSGRLAGAEIARSEVYKSGKIPLSTLTSDIDYGFSTSFTRYGTIGVKVWIYRGKGKEGQYLKRKTEEEE